MARVRKKIDTFTIPDGGRRRVYRPCSKSAARPVVLSIKTAPSNLTAGTFRLTKAASGHFRGKRSAPTRGANRIVPFSAKTQYDRAHIGCTPGGGWNSTAQ